MVCTWFPEPPNDVEERMSVPSQVVLVESEDSEDEMLGNAPPGYELLPQGPALGLSSEEEDQSDAEVNGGTASGSSGFPVDAPSTSDSLARRLSEVEEVSRLFAEPALRPELAVDCEAVRAAMSGFSLPPSSFPVWATNVPETQLTATLTQHIQRIQTDRRNM